MRNPLLKLIYNLLGCLFLIIIMVCLFSMGKFLYFQPYSPATPKEQTFPEQFTKKLRKDVRTGHFHVSEGSFTTDVETAPLCLRCHGNFCHTKSEEFRSYYNMHTFFLACETCHIRKESDAPILFRWFDDKTGKELKAANGQDENYDAKIVPVKGEGQKHERLDKFPEEKLALDFLKNKDSYSSDQKEKIKQQLMKHVSKKPVTCEECHCKQSYLNYRELGYDESRSSELSRIEIVKMIQEYREFQYPTFFNSEKNN